MSEPKKLSEAEIRDLVDELDGWTVDDGKLHKSFKFDDFSEAFGWMTRVAIEAEKLNHHPDWCNTWNTVDVHLKTHDIGALSELDEKMARSMEELAGS